MQYSKDIYFSLFQLYLPLDFLCRLQLTLNPFFFLSFSKRITCEDALDSEYFAESPKAIDPSMFPTWPAKSEISAADKERLKKQSSPKPPSGKPTVH